MSKDGMPQFWDVGCMLVTGCYWKSKGCDHCWSAKAHAMRMNNPNMKGVYSPELMTDGKFNGKVQFNLRLLEGAIKRAKPGQSIAPWNDLYHEKITAAKLADAHTLMERAKNITFLIITKRIEGAAEYCQNISAIGGGVRVPDNIWHIATCENQAMADKRIPHLLKIPGKRGIIIEPMLEAVDLTKSYPEEYCFCTGCGYHGLHDNYDNYECTACQHTEDDPDDGGCGKCGGQMERVCPSCGANDWNDGTCYGPVYTYREDFPKIPGIHQVILGPENGAGKRPFDPAWSDDVKAQCEAAGVPFYRKDTGEGELAWR